MSGAFKDFLGKKGIKHQCTMPYTPQQNGVAERKNRFLMEMARCMLKAKSLPHKLWMEAVACAAHVLNRCPTCALKTITPYESWYDRKPSISYLRVFGCLAYARIPQQLRGKLDDKAVKCIFVGYNSGSKGYRLYNLATNKIFESRDVIFAKTTPQPMVAFDVPHMQTQDVFEGFLLSFVENQESQQVDNFDQSFDQHVTPHDVEEIAREEQEVLREARTLPKWTVPSSSVRQLKALVEEVAADDNELKLAFKNLHQGYLNETLERFLKARDGNISKAFKMLVDCLHWRATNDIDNILSKLIEPKEAYDALRESQLIGMTGYCKQGRPVFAIGVGLSGYDKASLDKYVQSHIQINEYRDRILLPQATKKMGHYVGTCLKILDMSSLKFSALNRLKILTAISTVDDLNYPEKTDIYYIVNPPYIFSTCWQSGKSIAMDFIFDLPRTQNGHDGIWTFIDRFSKQAHFVPVKKTAKPDHLARLFVAQIFRLHGMPETIVSDRDPRFTSLFWKAIWENIGTRLQLSSSFHPQTDGQSEIANSVVLDLLKSYISDQKTQWERCLPLVEFAYNNTIHSSTGKAPFEIVEDFAKVRETLQKSQERQKKAADRHRRDSKLKENDWVLLRFDKARLRQKNGKEELIMRYYGPFQITEQINDISFRLRLPDTWKIHNVFHVNLWKTFGDMPDDGEPDEQPEVEANEEILVPEQVLAPKVTKKGKARRRFLIEFKNFPAFDAKWMEEEDLADTPQILKLYLEAFGVIEGDYNVFKRGVCHKLVIPVEQVLNIFLCLPVQVVRPLLQERTKRKIRVLQGCGREELLKVIDPQVLPFFCQNDSKRGGSSKGSRNEETVDCYSSSHAFHVDLWNYIKQQSYASSRCVGPAPQPSFHVEVPEPDAEVQTIECALETALVQLADSSANGKGNGDVLNGISGLSVKDA
ncbi:hypothetical protein L7F22_036941 [Adiantum nelumboides]|nr:hypothetical protein [Adiantum nelumboides]